MSKRFTIEKQSNIRLKNVVYSNTTVRIRNCKQVVIERCTFNNASLFFLSCDNVSVINCSFNKSNSKHCVQFDKSKNIRVAYNSFNEPVGKSPVEDIISLYKSDDAIVEFNYLVGGGPSKSGGGIMLGDNMGSNQVARNNICIDCGQYGIAIAGGNNNRIQDNIVMSKRTDWSNVGIYVWGIPQRNSKVTNASVVGNTISWKNKDNKDNSLWISKQNVENCIQQGNLVNVPYDPPLKPPGVGV